MERKFTSEEMKLEKATEKIFCLSTENVRSDNQFLETFLSGQMFGE